MPNRGLDVFDKTVQESNVWLKSLLERIGGEDRHRAYIVLKATLHALRDRIGPANAAHLSAQLPMLIRGLFYEGWRPAEPPTTERQKQEFLDRIRAELPAGMKINAEEAARAVFAVVAERIVRGEAAKVTRALPAHLKELWPEVRGAPQI